MFRKREKLGMPMLNTTSTADISFMLLIFFLVVSSMDIDQGLLRQLPSKDKESIQKETLVDQSQLMQLSITADNKLLIDDVPTDIRQLRPALQRFIARQGASHLIALQSDPASLYDTYFQVQNELVLAYKHVRNAYSMKKYGKKFQELDKEQREKVMERVPQHIAEVYHDAPTDAQEFREEVADD
ncbi:MAG: biopolymer transporter ExbD [Prevotella sp.]|nr:biopolymer transporter ExbD [Prevotella sp.]